MTEGPAVGVVGPDADPAAAAVRAAGGAPDCGPASAVVPDSDYVVAVGDAAVLAVARARPDCPVLPVAADRSVRSVPRDGLEPAVAALLADEYEPERHPLLDVTVADRAATTVLCDVMLVSAEPAQISEYTVSAGERTVARFRADGVVVATPAGSGGYAESAGGPVVEPETGVAAVVPVAPFATDADHWVVDLASVAIAVERDETAVQLVADDRVVGPVDPGNPVRMAPAGAVTVAVVAESRSPFDG